MVQIRPQTVKTRRVYILNEKTLKNLGIEGKIIKIDTGIDDDSEEGYINIITEV